VTRHIKISPVSPTEISQGVFLKGSALQGTQWFDTHFMGAGQATIISPNVGQNELVDWHMENCLVEGVPYWDETHRKWRVVPKWLVRTYQMSKCMFKHVHFRGKPKANKKANLIEHCFYADLDYQHGNVEFEDCTFEDASSQGSQFVGPWSRPDNAFDPELSRAGQGRAANSGKLRFTNCMWLFNAKSGYWSKRGISRPATQLGIYKITKGSEAYVHSCMMKFGNWLPTKTSSGGMAFSRGGLVAEHQKYFEMADTVIQSKQPGDRPAVQLGMNAAFFCTGNRVLSTTPVPSKVLVIGPRDGVWEHNSGWGSVYEQRPGKGNVKLGPISGRYEWRDGQLQ